MKVVPFLFASAAFALRTKNKRNAIKCFAWKRFSYTITLCSLLGVASMIFFPLTAYAAPRVVVSDYYVCGNEAVLDGDWNQVQPTDTVSTPYYSGSVLSYTGAKGYTEETNSSVNTLGAGSAGRIVSGNCTGVYHWGWNQYYHKATWIWPADYPSGATCTVQVYIPHWYAGAPDAQYTLSGYAGNVISTDPTWTIPFTPFNQDQATNGWYDLTGGQQVLSFTVQGSYHLVLTLTNGTTPWLYLGADAVRSHCISG